MSRRGMALSNGLREMDVEFRTREESSAEPSSPEYVKVTKVLHLCGAAEYIESVEWDAEREGTLRMNGGNGFRVVPLVQIGSRSVSALVFASGLSAIFSY